MNGREALVEEYYRKIVSALETAANLQGLIPIQKPHIDSIGNDSTWFLEKLGERCEELWTDQFGIYVSLMSKQTNYSEKCIEWSIERL